MSELSKELQLSAIKIINDLFGEGGSQEIPLRDGRVIKCRTATMKNFKSIVALVEATINGLDQNYLVKLIDKVAEKQTAIINGETDQPLDLVSTIREIAGQGSVVLKIVQAGADTLTKLIPMFTDLTEEQVDDLEMDELSLVAFGVLSKNYEFFIQQVLPSVLACIGHLRTKNQKASQA